MHVYCASKPSVASQALVARVCAATATYFEHAAKVTCTVATPDELGIKELMGPGSHEHPYL